MRACVRVAAEQVWTCLRANYSVKDGCDKSVFQEVSSLNIIMYKDYIVTLKTYIYSEDFGPHIVLN